MGTCRRGSVAAAVQCIYHSAPLAHFAKLHHFPVPSYTPQLCDDDASGGQSLPAQLVVQWKEQYIR